MTGEPLIELLRHGHTGQRSYRGQLDDPLSEQGWAQLRATAATGTWDAVVSSTLQRCAAFATELATQRGLPLRLDARLMEYHFGDWQGVPIEDIDRDAGPALGRFWADPVDHPPPGGEPFAAFRGRLSAALDQIAADHAGSGRRVLVVTHGGAIRALRCIAEGRPFGQMVEIEVPHASLHPLAWPPADA
ncbi:fructose-2,6-bisphosphatase [Stenotrophomonas panacihumi]|uniref:Fructose-2,6-bisphosphatase n=1 Tax=Stenotrophomonas panacihumi TaxID=676599 RepID=A0A0R0AHC2_9GAMM|nr:histidine phosphatase family protein [Stenotrophomonas panacihumi]KRG40743.1 fructose-2,6-bisphosphatase [Stenotrophomonas panacihumi]PTN54820.1 fructose-2,6-bisphosphatase [Stenotrophomonas panacihumi]